ncbi:MAG: hypothetical protein KY464_15875, partial [Gemmatimonadetes bacterium]|nr:hypothetical protein [Gemmatimonadota bacterium]
MMDFKRIKAPALAALTAMVLFAACDNLRDPSTALVGPGEASFERGGNSVEARGKVKVRGKKGGWQEYNLATGVLPNRKDVRAVKLIGPDGGELRAAG